MILRTIKIIRKNDTSRTGNIHNNKFQLNSKKKLTRSRQWNSPIKKKFQWTKTDFIKDLSASKDSNVNSHLRKWRERKKKENSGIRVGRRLENPRAAA